MNMKTLETLPGCLECQEVKSAAELKPCREAGTCYLCGKAICRSSDLAGYDVYRFCAQSCYEAELARQGVLVEVEDNEDRGNYGTFEKSGE